MATAAAAVMAAEAVVMGDVPRMSAAEVAATAAAATAAVVAVTGAAAAVASALG